MSDELPEPCADDTPAGVDPEAHAMARRYARRALLVFEDEDRAYSAYCCRVATDVYRELAAIRADVFAPEFAAMLEAFSRHHAAAERWAEALAPRREAIALRETVAAGDAGAAALMALAASLHAVGELHRKLEQIEEAQGAFRASAATYQRRLGLHTEPVGDDDTRLAASVGLIESLIDLSRALGARDRSQAAIEAAREAVAVARDAHASPGEPLAGLFAHALVNLHSKLDADVHAESLALLDEAIALQREAAAHEADPGMLMRLSLTHRSRARVLERLDRHEEARVDHQASREARERHDEALAALRARHRRPLGRDA